ncbi:MAG: tRNA (adenosine(37)-N6)-threonylcarbamoyltransferase complex dimerization subunit type 1 TsaB [Phycisphaerales bacterium]|nr:tRNA (adenosine(37)-N6)-threonylcarbamoyltransferase complex dimerization subunit type 1 TsaB [Phycisphaerales bacterium]
MKLLALDTATEACSAAVWVDGAVTERYQLAPCRHTTLILPMIEAVLAEAGLSPRQLDAIAFGRGPGAFTGVRIAASMAQGLAFSVDLPVVPVSTLATLALGVGQEVGQSRLAVALDARMGEVYWGTYALTADDAESLSEERVCAPVAVTVPAGGDWFGAGSGWGVYAAILSKQLAIQGYLEERYPHAGDVARLAAVPSRRADWVSADLALPVYLRNQVVAGRVTSSG